MVSFCESPMFYKILGTSFMPHILLDNADFLINALLNWFYFPKDAT